MNILRILFSILLLSFLPNMLIGQINVVNSYKSKMDSAFTPLLQTQVRYGRLYDRVFPWSGIAYEQNGDTVDTEHVLQDWNKVLNSGTAIGSISDTSYLLLNDSLRLQDLRGRISIIALNSKITTIDTLAYEDGRMF